MSKFEINLAPPTICSLGFLLLQPSAELTWMVHQGPFPVSFLDLVLRGILVNPQDLVVIFPLALLQLQLRIL